MSTDIEIAKPFVQATIQVLSTMAGISPTPNKPYLKKDNLAQGDVSATVTFTGAKTGVIAVSFTKACAIGVVKGMLGDDIQDIMQDTKDTVGEIINMISGQARARLAETGLTLQGSTPTVTMSPKHTIDHAADASIMAIPFSTDHGEFTIEFSFST